MIEINCLTGLTRTRGITRPTSSVSPERTRVPPGREGGWETSDSGQSFSFADLDGLIVADGDELRLTEASRHRLNHAERDPSREGQPSHTSY